MPFYGLPQPGLCQPEGVKVPVSLHFGRLDEYKGFSDPDVSAAVMQRCMRGSQGFIRMHPQ